MGRDVGKYNASTSIERIASMSVTRKKRRKEQVSVHSGAQQPQSVKGKQSVLGAQQPRAHGDGETVTETDWGSSGHVRGSEQGLGMRIEWTGVD